MHYYGDGWGGWVAMAIWMVVFWGGLIGLALWFGMGLSRRSGDGGQSHEDPMGSAHRILDERFARGEIGADEYQSRREVLAH